MTRYRLTALDANGKPIEQMIQAATAAEAEFQLRGRGYHNIELHEDTDTPETPSGVDHLRERMHQARPQPQVTVRKELARTGFILGAISTLFLLAGGLALAKLAIIPMYRLIDARSWVETPCTIVSSKLASHTGKNRPKSSTKTTYSIEILYTYQVDGKRYQSDQYNFAVLSTNTSVQSRRQIVKDHPPGKTTVCYVNPRDPEDAVLSREWSREMFWGLFPLIFVFVGTLGVLYCCGWIGSKGRPQVGAVAAGSDSPTL